jgi:hypothetical protein
VTCTECGRSAVARNLCGTCYSRISTRQKAYGRWESRYVPAEPVREYLHALRAAGVDNKTLRQAGVHPTAITYLLYGRGGKPPSRSILRATADKILAIPVPRDQFEYTNAAVSVVAVGTARRLRALVAYGYPQRDLCTRIGQSPGWCSDVVTGRSERVTATSARAVAELFTQLQMVPGTDRNARRRAKAKGWLPPLAWDEERIDDPVYEPEVVQTPRTPEDDFTDFEYLLSSGEGVEAACARLGLAPASLKRKYERHGRQAPGALTPVAWRQRKTAS